MPGRPTSPWPGRCSGGGRSYEDAVGSFEPYERVQEPNEAARAGLRAIVAGARARKIPASVFVNNRSTLR